MEAYVESLVKRFEAKCSEEVKQTQPSLNLAKIARDDVVSEVAVDYAMKIVIEELLAGCDVAALAAKIAKRLASEGGAEHNA